MTRVTHYGEVTVDQFVCKILANFKLAVDGSSAFMDIGSGGGALVLAAALSRGMRAVGLEIVGHRHAVAQEALQRARAALNVPLLHVSFAHVDATCWTMPSDQLMNFHEKRSFIFCECARPGMLAPLCSHAQPRP